MWTSTPLSRHQLLAWWVSRTQCITECIESPTPATLAQGRFQLHRDTVQRLQSGRPLDDPSDGSLCADLQSYINDYQRLSDRRVSGRETLDWYIDVLTQTIHMIQRVS